MKIVPYLLSFASVLIARPVLAKNMADFGGVYTHNHSLYLMSEDRLIPNVEDVIRIQPVDEKKANLLIETYSQNFHSCQLIGEAELRGDSLVFTSDISRKMSRGRVVKCVLTITRTITEAGQKEIHVSDRNENCKLRYCGMTAELGGTFKEKTVQIQDTRKD